MKRGSSRTISRTSSWSTFSLCWVDTTTAVAFTGLPAAIDEDRLKATGAAAASTGSVGLFHIEGVTPERFDRPREALKLEGSMLHAARDRLSTVRAREGDRVDAIAVGSPHFSIDEFRRLLGHLAGRKPAIPIYVCTGRHTLAEVERLGLDVSALTIVADTCIAVTPILPEKPGAILINTSRGPIVDEKALIAALSSKSIGGAGLDVFDVEPLPLDHPFRKMDNVVITPHLGYVSQQNYQHYFPDIVDDIRQWLDGKPVRVIAPK